MKKISLLLLFITLFSACNKETEEIEDATINANNSSITQRIPLEGNNTNMVTFSISMNRLQVYTYAIGYIFETHFQETASQFEAYTYTNAVGQEVLNLKHLLNGSTAFKVHFIEALDHITSNNFGLPTDTYQSVIMHPPIGDLVNDEAAATYFTITIDIENDLDMIFTGNISDNIEIYMARTIDPNTNSIRIAPHPLTNANSTNGYIFNEGNVANSAAIFNNSFLNSHNENVLIVRPYRDTYHPYDNIYVSDFTLFYN